MSVITDALKAAQREKSRRESQGVRSTVAPVLVPLRAGPRPGISWTGVSRNGVLAFSAVAVIVIGVAAVAMMKNPARSSLPTVPPLTSTILSEALADSANRSRSPVPQATIPPTREAPRTVAAAPSAPRTPPRVAALPGPVSARSRDTTTILQGQARAAVVSASAPPAAPEARPTGRLRIAVEQPRQPEAARLLSEAVAAHRTGDIVSARRLYDTVLVLTPGDADALNNLGVLLSAQREYGRALELLRRAATATPKNAGVWNNIGTVFHEQGKNNDAIAAFRHALTIDPLHPGAKVGLAQQYLAISALSQAKSLLDEVIAAHPQLPEAHYTLGQVLELQGDRTGAIRAYGVFVKAAPARLASHVELVRRRVDALSRGS
jgi:Tfp pilus assembly protein PilF